jgi:ribosomal-protein-alanine N-acetyltransferase
MNIESNTALIKTMTCRPIRAGDLADVVIIEKAATEFPWSLKNFQGCLKAGYKAWVFSNETGEVVGFAILQKVVDELHLLNVCVKKQFQGEGIGHSILNFIIDYAKDSSFSLIVLEVRASNSRAQKLYSKVGFNEMSVRKDYYPAYSGREDAILMGLDLLILPCMGDDQ